MSVYSGFSTRQQETQYGKLTERLIQHMQAHILATMHGEKIDHDAWAKQFYNIYLQMSKLEVNKYLEPHFSYACKQLVFDASKRSKYEPYSTLSSFTEKLPNRLDSTRLVSQQTPKRKPWKSRQGPRSIKSGRPTPKSLERTRKKSNHYTKIMKAFLQSSFKTPQKKVRQPALDDRDFWLIDDTIQLMS